MYHILSKWNRKKPIFIWVALLISPIVLSQSIFLENRPMAQTDFALVGFDIGNRNVFFKSEKTRHLRAQRGFYINKSWDTAALVRLTSGEEIVYDQSNFNLKKNEYEIIQGDGLPKYLPNHREVTQVIFNGRRFDRLSDERKYFELLKEGKSFSVYRLSNVRIKKAFVDSNTLKKIGKDKVSLHHTYFFLRESDGYVFRVSKKNILDMLPDKSKKLKKYIEDNGISLKDKKDILKMNQILENLYPKI